jgi:ketosteroid isomerase-like protein
MTDTRSITETLERYIRAFNTKDTRGMAAMLTDDVVVMPPNKGAITGKAAFCSWQEESIAGAIEVRLDVTPIEIEVMDRWAFDRFGYSFALTPVDGGTVRERGYCVWILRKDSDEWRAARAIWTSVKSD